MESANLSKMSQAPAGVVGELVLQNGRQAGARRPLGMPTTFIGRSHGCDIRLNLDGIDGIHCVLIYGPDGLTARDLNSGHGTYVNGDRITSMPIRHGDLLKVGPFQFRVEMTAPVTAESSDAISADGAQDALHVQVAAVAAQQIALEEEETRIVQLQSDMRQQEEQLASHLAEKQRQVQMWSDHTKAERDALRKQKAEQQKVLSKWEQELSEAKEHLGEEQQRLIQERQRINKVYQRLRQRWQRQWSMEKHKYQELAARMAAETKALEARQTSVREQEASLAQESVRFNTERELGSRQLTESWESLKKDQGNWKRRQVHERALVKARQQELEETITRLNEARQTLHHEKEAWQKQQDTLQKELLGLNSRIVHQRQLLKEQEEKVVDLDGELRTRLLHLQRVAEIESSTTPKDAPVSAPADAAAQPAGDRTEEAVTDDQANAPAPAAGQPAGDRADEAVFPVPVRPEPAPRLERDPAEALHRLAQELADQRVHLVEQYKRLAEVHEVWSLQREQAGKELEETAAKLLAQEESLTAREQHADGAERNLTRERAEVQVLRQEIQLWRGRLKAREQAVEQEHQKRLQALRQQEMLLQEQLSGLTDLRQRWNRRRQEEIERLRVEQGQLQQQRMELAQLRKELFEKGHALEEEKRILAEKTLTVEQYRQEVASRAKDPASERRIERLRRRWLMQNAAQIRHAKQEHETVQMELSVMEARLHEWTAQMQELAEVHANLAEQQSALDERETLLNSRQQRIQQELAQTEVQRQLAEEKYLGLQDEVERMAKLVYEQPETPAWQGDKAA